MNFALILENGNVCYDLFQIFWNKYDKI